MMEKMTSEGSRTPAYRSFRKHDRANEKQVLPYKKRVLSLGSNDARKASQSEMPCATYISRQSFSSSSDTKFGVEKKNKSEIHRCNKISSSTTFDKDEISASVSLLELRDPSGKLPLAMSGGNDEGCVKKSEGDKIPVKGPRSIRIRFGNHIGIIRSDLPRGDGVSKDGGSGVGDTKLQADKTKVIENEVGDDRSNGKESLGDGHGNNGHTPAGAVGDRKNANDAHSNVVGKGRKASKGKGVMKQEGGNGRSTGSEPQGDGNGKDGSPVFVDAKQTDKIKEVIEDEAGRGGGNTGSKPADDAKDDEPGTITGDGKKASKRKEVILENKVGGDGSTRCEPQGENGCKDSTASVVGGRKQAEKIKVIEHGGGGFSPIEMAVEGMNAGICEGDHEKQELPEKEDGGNSNSVPGEEQNNKDKDVPEYVVSTTVYANEPDVVEQRRVNLADRVTSIEGSNSRLPADGTLTQSLDLEDGSSLSPVDSTNERDKNGNNESSFHEQGQVVAVEDASDDKNNRNREAGREEETIEGKKTVDDVVPTKVRDEVEPEGGQDGRGNEADMIIGEEKTHEADPVTKLVCSGRHSPANTTIKTRNDDNIEDLYEPKKNLTEDGGNEGGIINELVEQDQQGKKIIDRYVVSTIIQKAGSGSGSGIKEPEGGLDCNNNPPDVGNGGKLKPADQVTNSAGCVGNAPPTNFTLGGGSDTEGNHEKRIQKASFLLPDGGRGNDSSVAPAGGTTSHYIQISQDAKTILSGRKRSHNSHDQGEVSQDRVGGDAVGQKERKKYKEGINEGSGINSNAPGCNEPPKQQAATHTFRLFGVDIDVPERESTISHVQGGHGGGESSMKKCKAGLRLMGHDI